MNQGMVKLENLKFLQIKEKNTDCISILILNMSVVTNMQTNLPLYK